MKKVEIESVEVMDDTQENENGLFNILEVSVLVELKNGVEIDFQTSMIDHTRFSTSLEAYLDGTFELSDLDKDEDVAREILSDIAKMANIQSVYDEYIKENYILVDEPIDWETQKSTNYLARKARLK